MNDIFNAKLYDFIVEKMESCVWEINWKDFRKFKRMLILGTNVTAKFETLIQHMQKENPALEIIVIAQIQMLEKMSVFLNDRCQCIEWQGRYTTDVIKILEEKTDISEIDAFLYFGSQNNDLRDLNYWQIANTLNDYRNIAVFMMDSARKIWQIGDISKYVAAMELYQAVGNFLEVIGG